MPELLCVSRAQPCVTREVLLPTPRVTSCFTQALSFVAEIKNKTLSVALLQEVQLQKRFDGK